MPSIEISLREIKPGQWQLFAPKGHPISSEFRGNKYEAFEWATIFCSTWSNWTVKYEENDETKRFS